MLSIKAAVVAMIVILMASNYLVLFPINDWLTWGAFPYPATFLVSELTNRFHGPRVARRVVYVGFIIAAFFSIWLATPKIAFASVTAFLVAQLMDISIFNKLRVYKWWYAPLFSSLAASVVDTSVFFNLAFWGESLPILTWAIGDFSVKVFVDVALLTPFRLATRNLSSGTQRS